MTRVSLLIVALLFAFLACTPEQNTSVTSSPKTISLEITGGQVVLLDNKEVHIDYLHSVLSDLKTEFDISALLRISADTPMGIVSDVQQTLNRNAIKVLRSQ